MSGNNNRNEEKLTPLDIDHMEFDAEKYFPQAFHRGIREAIREGIEIGIRAHCRIPISQDEAEQMRFFCDNVRQLGGGDFHKGMNEIHDNHEFIMNHRKDKEFKELKKDHEWVRRQRNRFDSAAKRLGGTLITFGAALLFTVIGYGIKEWIDMLKDK